MNINEGAPVNENYKNDIEHFAHLIRDIKFTMFTTFNAETGHMQSRPMTLQEMEFDGVLWFFANKNSEMVRQINANPTVNLSFSNIKNFSFLSAEGKAFLTVDGHKKEELWNPTYQAWFPEGIDDPQLGLVKVVVEGADYWESPDSKLVRLAGMAKAILGGKKADASLGKHGHLNLT